MSDKAFLIDPTTFNTFFCPLQQTENGEFVYRSVLNALPNPYYTVTVSPTDTPLTESLDPITYNVSINRFNGYDAPVDIVWQASDRRQFKIVNNGTLTEWAATINGQAIDSSLGDTVITSAPDNFDIVLTKLWKEGGGNPTLASMYLIGISGTNFVLSNDFAAQGGKSTFGRDYVSSLKSAYDLSIYHAPPANSYAVPATYTVPLEVSAVNYFHYNQREKIWINKRWNNIKTESSSDNGITWQLADNLTSKYAWIEDNLNSDHPVGGYVRIDTWIPGIEYEYLAPMHALALYYNSTLITRLPERFFFKRDVIFKFNNDIEPVHGNDFIKNSNGVNVNTTVAGNPFYLATSYLMMNDIQHNITNFISPDFNSITKCVFRVYNPNTNELACESKAIFILTGTCGITVDSNGPVDLNQGICNLNVNDPLNITAPWYDDTLMNMAVQIYHIDTGMTDTWPIASNATLNLTVPSGQNQLILSFTVPDNNGHNETINIIDIVGN
jgi:hypothetical protein